MKNKSPIQMAAKSHAPKYNILIIIVNGNTFSIDFTEYRITATIYETFIYALLM